MFVLTNYTTLFIHVCFILYIFFLKYKNKEFIMRNFKLKNTIKLFHVNQKNYITEINKMSQLQKDYKQIEKKNDDIFCQSKLYIKIISKLEREKEKEKLIQLENKNNNDSLKINYKKLNRDMDKLANSYKDLYKSYNQISNKNKELIEQINILEQEKHNLNTEIFIFKNINNRST